MVFISIILLEYSYLGRGILCEVRVWGGGGGGTILNVVMKEYIIEKMTF